MTFMQRLIADATPQAEKLTNTTANVVNKLVDNRAVSIAKNVSYKALVNTVGIGLAMAQPIAKKAWSKVEDLASDPKPVSR